MSSTSTNPVQNKVIKAYVDGKFNEASKVYDWLEFDEEEQAVKVNFPLYSVGSITAGGKKEDSGGGGGTGGIDYDALETYLKVNEYATQSWVKGQGYVTQSWVKDQGYVTSSSLDDTFTAIDNRLAALEKLLEWFEFDENENMIKAKFGIYSVGAITAGKKEGE
jgi:hypothetical protein